MDKTLVFQHDKIKLFHYLSNKKKKHSPPLLIVFATINRPDILELYPEQSFIGSLIDQGMDVYLLDWGYPDANDINIAFADYVLCYLHNCIKFIIETSHQDKINLVGICQGGVISICYAALYAHINKLVLISTPIDFHTKDNRITQYLKTLCPASESWHPENLSSWPGNIPGIALTQFFNLLRPLESINTKYIKFAKNLDDQKKVEKFLRIEKWLYDAPDQPAKAFNEFAQHFYYNNELCKGEFELHGKKIKLENIRIPVFNIIAKNDEVIPPSASKALKKHINPEQYSQQYFSSGHIGVYVSEQVASKLPVAIARWLKNN